MPDPIRVQVVIFGAAVGCMAATSGAIWAPGAELSGALVALPSAAIVLLLLALSWPWLAAQVGAVSMWLDVAFSRPVEPGSGLDRDGLDPAWRRLAERRDRRRAQR